MQNYEGESGDYPPEFLSERINTRVNNNNDNNGGMQRRKKRDCPPKQPPRSGLNMFENIA